MEKPLVKLTGENGNVFNIIGIVMRALKKAGYPDKAKEYQDKVLACHSYDEVLQVTFFYVKVE